MTEDAAQTIALLALGFLAGDEERMARFSTATGMTLDDLATSVEDNATLASVLDALLADESMLLMFCAEADVAPERVLPARFALGGRYETST